MTSTSPPDPQEAAGENESRRQNMKWKNRDRGSLNLEQSLLIALLVLVSAASLVFLGGGIACLYSKATSSITGSTYVPGPNCPGYVADNSGGDTTPQVSYFLSDGSGTITGYDTAAATAAGQTPSNVTIPASIDGVPTTAIGNGGYSEFGDPMGLPGFADLTGSLTVPESVKSVGYYAFFADTGLTSISMPGVTSIGESAFLGNALTSVSLPAVTSIGQQAFYYSSGLTSVSLPAVKTIDSFAFGECLGVTSLSLPEATVIGESAFEGCTALTGTLSLPAVKTIDSFAFQNCPGITSVSMPLVEAVYVPFYGCTGITEFSVAADNATYSTNDGVLFDKPGTTLVDFPAGKTGYYAVPDGTTAIGDYAFLGVQGLASVTFPPSLTTVGATVFYGSTGVTVNRPAARTEWTTDFLSCDAVTTY